MSHKITCFNIPDALLKYKKSDTDANIKEFPNQQNFGVKVIRNALGEIERTDYYADNGELLKSIYYKGALISVIKHYRNNILYAEERFFDGKLVSKGFYDRLGNVISGVAYKYDRKNKIISIEKSINNFYYLVEYAYDELDRVNGRTIKFNNNIVNYQHYKFDILDRISEYEDNNQKIVVLKINKKNELIHYKITDKIGNEIVVVNKFFDDSYINTEITLNGHITTVEDKSYLDNIMLKKPYTTEDDLDLIIANLFASKNFTTQRHLETDATEIVIEGNIKPRVLPISIRKRLLYYNVMNL